MIRRKRTTTALTPLAVLATVASFTVPAGAIPADDATIEEVLKQLNQDSAVKGTEESKSYRMIFDAYRNMTDPPMEVGPNFNMRTIHAEMDNWSAVAGWAESNAELAEAILNVPDTTIFGMPYGARYIQSTYREADLMAEIAPGNELRKSRFPYLDAIETVSAYTTAEVYRRFESGQSEQAIELIASHLILMRQLCDRLFLVEKRYSIQGLRHALANLRDVMYVYQDEINPQQFYNIGFYDVPFLRPGRQFLFMPEGDRIVSEALIKQAFDQREQADAERFRDIFAGIQAEEKPLTRFGAARRWEMVAQLHASLEASLNRLKLIYDDWWRRWRVHAYDPILDIKSQFENTNSVRYAAVLFSMKDISDLFAIRRNLIADVRGTALSAGLCAYNRQYGTYPNAIENIYGEFARKSVDSDPYDRETGPFGYIYLSSRHPVDTNNGRLWIERNNGILYARGVDHEDNRADTHTPDGSDGDIVYWPPIRSLQREQGLID